MKNDYSFTYLVCGFCLLIASCSFQFDDNRTSDPSSLAIAIEEWPSQLNVTKTSIASILLVDTTASPPKTMSCCVSSVILWDVIDKNTSVVLKSIQSANSNVRSTRLVIPTSTGTDAIRISVSLQEYNLSSDTTLTISITD